MIDVKQKMKVVVLKRFDENPQLLKIISRNEFLGNLDDIEYSGNSEHPVVRVITRNFDLPAWLSILEEKKPDVYLKIIRKIKSCNDPSNMDGLMSELKVLAFYLQRFEGKDITYEPPVGIGKKKNDISIHLNNKEIHVEILALTDASLQKTEDHFRKLVEKIKNPFVIWLELPHDPTPREMDEFDQFIIEKVETSRLEKRRDYQFEYSGLDGHSISLHMIRTNKKGNFDLMSNSDASWKIKGKLEEKLKQVPKNKPVIFIVDLANSPFTQFFNFQSGVLGQIDLSQPVLTSFLPRMDNGFSSLPGANDISALIAFKSDLNGDSQCVINKSSKFQFSRVELKLLMPENIFQAIENGTNS